MTNFETDQTHGQSLNLELKPGMGWAVYTDEGPTGICAQSCRVTCPHTVLMTWESEDAMLEELKTINRKGHRSRLVWGVVDSYTAGGVFRIIQKG